jgi:hypothetical protein
MESRVQATSEEEDRMKCEHCGYKLVNGQCPIPCKGKPLADDHVAVVQPITLYWTPKAA